ncbi:MAG: YicC family protein [Rhizobiales bacterium]|nr:YicC family protein [Hyphomicrobiales bacterium]
MPLKSMTGFSRATGSSEEAQWIIELRSVNGRGLDMRVRLPNGMEALDSEFRKQISNKLSRGNITVNFNMKKHQSESSTELNVLAFNDLLKAAKQASEISGLPMPDLGTLLTSRNILKEAEKQESEEKVKEMHARIMKSFNTALDDLIKARKDEGVKLSATIKERLKTIKELTEQAEKLEERKPEAIKERLKQSINHLLDQQIQDLDENRLHQEAMIIATRVDIAEELDRIKAHVAQAEELVEKDDPVGRRFDFLCQEFNREANTICSKASVKKLTYIGLELKTIIDQLREQVQNIE